MSWVIWNLRLSKKILYSSDGYISYLGLSFLVAKGVFIWVYLYPLMEIGWNIQLKIIRLPFSIPGPQGSQAEIKEMFLCYLLRPCMTQKWPCLWGLGAQMSLGSCAFSFQIARSTWPPSVTLHLGTWSLCDSSVGSMVVIGNENSIVVKLLMGPTLSWDHTASSS